MFSYWSITFLCFLAIKGYADVCFSCLKKNWEQMYLDVFVEKCTRPLCQVTHFTTFCTVVPKICGSSIGNVLHAPFWHKNFDVAYKFLENLWPQLSFTSRNGILRFEENLIHQGFVCVSVRMRLEVSVLCSLCVQQPFFRWALFLYLAYIAVGWPNSSQFYSYFFCCVLYLFNMSKFSESDELLPLGIVCKQWLQMLIV